jgi:cellulose synthase/poly-beta-1,6-N-acetylglucosamine synthase-like glycosyltransferase
MQNKKHLPISWFENLPESKNEIALIIPQFNESANSNFIHRLEYFRKVANEFVGVMDVIIVDDGSTDGSLLKIKSFMQNDESALQLAVVSPNMNKVGALHAAVASINHQFVILSDFDTDINGLDSLFDNLPLMKTSPDIMGCYFRMLPFDGKGGIFLFQQLEYSMSRVCYKFYQREHSVPVMPGAGSCYKRTVLLNIYEQHSGLRSGEDRETTLIGLKLGYKTFYLSNTVTFTRPPLSFRSLLKQRVRWNLGYLETIEKERLFYYYQIRKLSLLGLRTLGDIIRINLVLLFPFALLFTLLIGWQFLFKIVLLSYCIWVIWPINAVLISPLESVEFKEKRLLSILSYPLYKIPLECVTWAIAIYSFVRNRLRPASMPTIGDS